MGTDYNKIGFKNKDIDKLSFDKAFSTSRSSGASTFSWRGKKYNTKTADDLVKENLTTKPGKPIPIKGMPGTETMVPHTQFKNLNTTNLTDVKKSISQKLHISTYYGGVYPYTESSSGPSIVKAGGSAGYMTETEGGADPGGYTQPGARHFNFGRGVVTRKADSLMQKAISKIPLVQNYFKK